MKKKGEIIVLVAVMLILSLGFVSASWFSDVWKWTGFATKSVPYNITCVYSNTTIEGPTMSETDQYMKSTLALYNSKTKKYSETKSDICFKKKVGKVYQNFVKEAYCVKKTIRTGERRDAVKYKQQKDYTLCEGACQNGACARPFVPSTIVCSEEQKSGLCGIQDSIFPLTNKIAGRDIFVFEPGLILENNYFKISLESPKFLLTNTQYNLNITIENTKQESNLFQYYYWACNSSEEVCSDIYGVINVKNIDNAEWVIEGKNEFWKSSFAPNEKKILQISINPENPTLVETPMNYLFLVILTEGFDSRITINFKPWIKPDVNYLGDPPISPQLSSCNDESFPRYLPFPRYVQGGVEHSYGFSISKCCNTIFYPSFDCCNDNDCKDRESSNGFCVDGVCMPKDKPSNKFFGTKKILIGYEFNDQDACENILLENIDPQLNEDFSKMEQYYDNMAQKLLNKPFNYLDFKIVKAIKVPSGLNNYYGDGKTEQDILDYLSYNCGINIQEFDIVILPTSVAQMGEAAGRALSVGNGKVALYQKGYAPTLIHETGHLFGCTDLYSTMGGKLQWAKTLYGNSRINIYSMINENRINEIPLKTFQVCRGELGWTDSNKNNIIDIEE